MANVRTGNTHYVDTAGVLTSDSVAVVGFVLTATSANAVAVIQDNQVTPQNKLNLRVATSGETKHFDFSGSPLSFAAGIKIGTLTNAILTVLYK